MERFADQGTDDLANGRDTKAARAILPRSLRAVAMRKLDAVLNAKSLSFLRVPPGNRLEALTADRTGQHSIRVNDQYRICFVWTEQGARLVEVTDYH